MNRFDPRWIDPQIFCRSQAQIIGSMVQRKFDLGDAQSGHIGILRIDEDESDENPTCSRLFPPAQTLLNSTRKTLDGKGSFSRMHQHQVPRWVADLCSQVKHIPCAGQGKGVGMAGSPRSGRFETPSRASYHQVVAP
jgi:hypothetical protein